MSEVSIIGIDLVKRSFQVHGADANGRVLFRKKLSRAQVLPFLSKQKRSVVAMESCASAHFWGREIGKLDHEVRLIPTHYVKPFVKRQKNDAADAEAIAEAAARPTMRFVAVKSEEQQARGMAYRVRDLLVRQRTQSVNALRGHFAEYGIVMPTGIKNVTHLESALADADNALPKDVQNLGQMLLDQIEACTSKLEEIEADLKVQARESAETARLMTMPGIGPITAMAIQAFSPAMEGFENGRHFAAWLGLVPRQNSTGGKPRLGSVSKMGQRDIRRLLIIGAAAVVRWRISKGCDEGTWLAGMLARKPRMVVVVALANKMARMVWAMQTRQEVYRTPALAA
jgi:transposase